jgi:hypothetical protein
LVSLMDLGTRLWTDMLVRNGVVDGWMAYAIPEAAWTEQFSLEKIERLEKEVRALPECANDGKWGFCES